MISHFTLSETGLMAAFLGMSGLAVLVALLATSIFVASMSLAGTSPIFDAVRAFVSFLLEKLWIVSQLSMMAIYNVVGAATACAIAAAGLSDNKFGGASQISATLIVALAAAISLSGSLIAWCKINGVIGEAPSRWSRQALSTTVIAIILAAGGYIAFAANDGANFSTATPELIFWLLASALLFGALITLPFGRTQMPAFISLFNACIGLAIGLEGLVLRDQSLLIAGFVIGSARLIVTLLMVEAAHEQWSNPVHVTGARIARFHMFRLPSMRGRHKHL